jgi:hypothetical protein
VERGGTFTLVDRWMSTASGEAAFAFDLDGEPFEERVGLPPATADVAPAALDLLLDVCHAAMGTSYFKLSAPRRLVFERPVAGHVAALARSLYDDGLREMAYRNGLPVPLETELVWKEAPLSAPPASRPGGRSGTGRTGRHSSPPGHPPLAGQGLLAPIGGGKDSAAVLALLPGATGLSISPTPAHERLARAAGVELLTAGRELDSRLPALSARPGALNGHVPITAVNSAVSAIVAATQGLSGVAMGNERSASEPTRTLGHTDVNHQYSKSLAFEAELGAVLSLGGTSYFSVLRQLSELAIAGIVASSPVLRRSFLSCNRAFRLARPADEEQRWCLQCPKCHFTYLCFAVYLDPGEAEDIFGGNPLADLGHARAFADLWDDSAKPFDCVGERAESAVAMAWLGEAGGWAEMPVVKELAPRALEVVLRAGTSMEDQLAVGGPHRAPPALATLFADAARASRPRR